MSLQIIVFELDKEEFGVPILELREVIKVPKITQVPGSPDFVLGIINLRGKVIPIVDMEKWFSLKRENEKQPENIIIVEDEKGSNYGVVVDRLKQVIKIEEEEIKPAPKLVEEKISQEFLKGVVVLEGDSGKTERVILILDMVKALSKLGLESFTKIPQTEEVKN